MQKNVKLLLYLGLAVFLVLLIVKFQQYYVPFTTRDLRSNYDEVFGYIVNYKDVRLIHPPENLFEITSEKSFQELIAAGCLRCGFLQTLPLCKSTDPPGWFA